MGLEAAGARAISTANNSWRLRLVCVIVPPTNTVNEARMGALMAGGHSCNINSDVAACGYGARAEGTRARCNDGSRTKAMADLVQGGTRAHSLCLHRRGFLRDRRIRRRSLLPNGIASREGGARPPPLEAIDPRTITSTANGTPARRNTLVS